MDKEQIIAQLKSQINEAQFSVQSENVGTVIETADGIAKISGLSKVMAGEMLAFSDKTYGLALNLEAGSVGAIILGDYTDVMVGQTVKSTGRILEVPVGEALI